MKIKINIRTELKIAALLLGVFGLIAFTERMKSYTAVGGIRINIVNAYENHFMDEQDILDLVQMDEENLRGANIDSLNFKRIENKIKTSPYVSDAELYGDLQGNLTVKVSLRRPVARIIRNNGPDGYIAEDGTIMPVSEKYTSRVVLLSGDFAPVLLRLQNMNQEEVGTHLMEMLDKINKDEFWKAQIAELDIDSKARIALFPQVGDEKIEFGKPENFDVKFRKLKIFYKEILPKVGWNKYDRVNLEYEGQIVAE